MKGYKISYVSPSGESEVTFFGEPMSNMDLSKSSGNDIIRMMFSNAHPGCKINSIEPMSFEEYEKNFMK